MSTESPIRATDHYFRDEDKTLRFTVTNSAGLAVDITGWAIEFVMRVGVGATALITKTVGSGITLTVSGSGILDVAIADSDTTSLDAKAYVYVLRRTDAGSEQVLAFGDLVLLAAAGT